MLRLHTNNKTVFKNRTEIEDYLLAKVEHNTKGRIGTELELFVTTQQGRPLTFRQVEKLLKKTARLFDDVSYVYEGHNIIGLNLHGVGDVSLEPGGQIELATKPCETLDELEGQQNKMYTALVTAAKNLHLNVIGTGHLPAFIDAEDMPRARFAAYYKYIENEISDHAKNLINTMKSICGLQVNMDPMGEDFHETYRSLMLVDLAIHFNQKSERQTLLNETYTAFLPEQTTPIFEALKDTSNQTLVEHITDRLLTLQIPFIADDSPQGFQSSIDRFGYAPSIEALMDNNLLTEDILDSALGMQMMMPNLRRHGVIETRAPDSVNSTKEVMDIARMYHQAAYDKPYRQKLLNNCQDIDPDLLRKAFNDNHRTDKTVISKNNFTVRDLIRQARVTKRRV